MGQARLLVDPLFLHGALGLPRGASVQAIEYNSQRDRWEFILEHEALPQVKEREEIPLAVLSCRQHRCHVETELTVGSIKLKGEQQP